jgi:hypothetical protein
MGWITRVIVTRLELLLTDFSSPFCVPFQLKQLRDAKLLGDHLRQETRQTCFFKWQSA